MMFLLNPYSFGATQVVSSTTRFTPSSMFVSTTEEILNLDKIRTRADRFRFELCDRDLNPIGDLHPDRNQSVPSITNDTANSTHRRLRGLKLLPDEQANVNLFGDRLRVYMTLQNDEEFRLGTFLWADSSNPVRSWGEEQHTELTDYGYILDQPTTKVYSWNRDSDYITFIMFIIDRAGIELGESSSVMGGEVYESIADPMAWEPGTTWLQILTDIGNLLGFAPPWFDRHGAIQFDQPPNPALDSAFIDYDEHPRMVRDSIVRTDDLISAPNQFAVFDSGTGRPMITGRAYIDPTAPHSFPNRGFRVGLTESVSGLTSQASANAAAVNLARTQSVAYEWLSFQSTADPRHDTYDIVKAFGSNWLETSWSLDLVSGGVMEHTLRRTSFEQADPLTNPASWGPSSVGGTA